MKLTGHKTESIYRRYAIVSETDLSDGVKKLASLHEAQAKAPRTVILISERTATEQPQFIQNWDKEVSQEKTAWP